MNNKIVCILMLTTINVDTESSLYKNGQLTPNKLRYTQYYNGIKKIYELNKDNLIDIYICDNSNFFNYESELKTYIIDHSTINIIANVPNVYGKINKGSGLIENWIHNINILNKYEWIIHFEPRQLLISNQFIESVLKVKRNLFTYGGADNWRDSNSYAHFNTGLFCIKRELLIEYIFSINLKTFNESIEYSIFNFIKKYNYTYDTLDRMDLVWYPTNHKELHF